MAGIDLYLIAQNNQLVDDRTHNPRIVAARKICAADALAEERVASQYDSHLLVIERNATRGVAGGRDNLQHGVAESQLLHRVKVDIHCRGERSVTHAEHSGRRDCRLEQEGIFARHRKGNIECTLHVFDTCQMVEVSVGVDRHNGFKTLLGDIIDQTVIFSCREVSGINHDALVALIPQNIGVLLNGIKCQFCNF